VDESTRDLLWQSTPKVWINAGRKLLHTYRGVPPRQGEGVETWGDKSGVEKWVVIGVRWSYYEEQPEVHVQVAPLAEAAKWAEQKGATLPDFGW
jgi:hypothetical protein